MKQSLSLRDPVKASPGSPASPNALRVWGVTGKKGEDLVAQNLNVITGGTGLLGSHIAEGLVGRGERVRAVVRTTSDTAFLETLGVEIVHGDLQDAASTNKALRGADIVFHCAAKVDDWGSWSDYQIHTVDATRHVVEASAAHGIGRLVHISAISAYGMIPHSTKPINEDHPIGQKLRCRDYYAWSKVLAEGEVRKFPRHTILRPPWFFGPRDRATLNRVVKALRSHKVAIIGSGGNFLSILPVSDVARGAILAAHEPGARGEAYNLTNGAGITQKDLLDLLTELLNLPPIQRHVPYFLAYQLAFYSELLGRILRQQRPPQITRRAVYMIGRSSLFDSKKAREQLSWEPQVPIRDAVRQSLEWFLAQEVPVLAG